MTSSKILTYRQPPCRRIQVFVLMFIIVMLCSRMISNVLWGCWVSNSSFWQALVWGSQTYLGHFDNSTLFFTLFLVRFGHFKWCDLHDDHLVVSASWFRFRSRKHQNIWIELDRIVIRNIPRFSKLGKFLVHACNRCGGLNKGHSLSVHLVPISL